MLIGGKWFEDSGVMYNCKTTTPVTEAVEPALDKMFDIELVFAFVFLEAVSEP